MPTREGLLHAGTRRGDRLLRELGQTARDARLGLGLSQAKLAEALRVSQPQVSRFERGVPPLLDVRQAARILRLLGLDLVLTCYPAGGQLRDAAHLALVRRFLALVHPAVPKRVEAPIPRPGDLRAWDVELVLEQRRAGIAAETRLRDIQALLRREQLKARDSGIERLILVAADTHANRRAIREASEALRVLLPLDGRALRPALRAGRDPGGNGLLIL